MEKKYFTLDEANALIPTLEFKMPRLLRLKKEMAEFLLKLNEKGMKVEDLLAIREADEELLQLKKGLEELGAAMNGAVADIQALGCLIKDLDLGLVDFYTLVEDEEILFCWQLGEKEIRYWHKTSEGFANRRALFEEDQEKEGEKLYH